MLVKEHALPRAAWLQLRHVRAAWQELGARLSEHQVGLSNAIRPSGASHATRSNERPPHTTTVSL